MRLRVSPAANAARKRLVHLIDVVTTNKTEFFREKVHFDFLISKAIPELLAGKEGSRDLLIWSAGCSTGEEPYTLAMLLSEYRVARPAFASAFWRQIFRTASFKRLLAGYTARTRYKPVPSELRRKYFMRSRDPDSELVRVVPEMRDLSSSGN